MSIRLRLTLLYSVILALTLIAFGTTLYVIQAKATLDAITTTLARQVEGLANAERRFPRRSDETPFSGTLPGRWTQTRDADGTVSARTADLSDTTLQLSDAGLRAVQNGSPWVETAQVEDVPLLIYSQPVIVQDRVTRIVQVASPVAEREHSLNTLRLILITASGLTILAAFAVGWALAGMALRPINKIGRAHV